MNWTSEWTASPLLGPLLAFLVLLIACALVERSYRAPRDDERRAPPSRARSWFARSPITGNPIPVTQRQRWWRRWPTL